MTGLNWRLAAFALLLGLCVGGRVAWLWQANDYKKQRSAQALHYSQEREGAAAAALDALEDSQTVRRALEDRLQAQDQTHFKELLDAQNVRKRLLDRLATADVRLSVLVAGPAPGSRCGVREAAGAGGVVHGPQRAELDPAHAQRIVSIVGDGDDGLKALQACQAYVLGVTGKEGG